MKDCEQREESRTIFYGRQSAISPWLSAFLILANSLTVLQIYRQAFSIPQLTHLNHFYLILIPETFLSSPKHLYLILIPEHFSLSWNSSLHRNTLIILSLRYPHSKKGFSKIWTNNLQLRNTCLNQLSYWNRQENYTFLNYMSKKERKREKEREREWKKEKRLECAQTGQHYIHCSFKAHSSCACVCTWMHSFICSFALPLVRLWLTDC